MMLKGIFLILISLFSVNTLATSKDTGNVTVELISVWSHNGNVLVQTNPRHNISEMACTEDYWMMLDKTEGGFDQALALLMMAQASGTNVTIRYDDTNNFKFCRLARVITTPPGR